MATITVGETVYNAKGESLKVLALFKDGGMDMVLLRKESEPELSPFAYRHMSFAVASSALYNTQPLKPGIYMNMKPHDGFYADMAFVYDGVITLVYGEGFTEQADTLPEGFMPFG